MAEWNGEYINPYAEHGKKSEQVKNMNLVIFIFINTLVFIIFGYEVIDYYNFIV